ncbi:DUF4250 domain-containing protein [Zophobihabitans entericus]|uniref:DUF4250 domain-containing protein n=1 Tax=Zophobihabitans entericus TaxID=1635327 RepID=A0A6G9IAF9_9GAMM|nr:DUF4250 domain-containing protein [Zophobihabitans entericus]QIQ21218.1 DUF4250 domain-containing protein [Zophobihabitans entericus]
MSLTNFKTMDVNILLSIVNMQLRDKYSSLNDLARYYDIVEDELCQKLAAADFHYDAKSNQFK